MHRPAGKGAVIHKADLEYVRQLLASTEALFKDVQAAMDEARRLQAEARTLHGQRPGYTGSHALPCGGFSWLLGGKGR